MIKEEEEEIREERGGERRVRVRLTKHGKRKRKKHVKKEKEGRAK